MTTSSSEKKPDTGLIEAILFASPRPVSEDRLASILEIPKKEVRKVMEDFIKKFNRKHEGIKIVRNRRHYYITIEDKYLDIVSRIMEPPPLNQRQKLVIALLYKRKEALLRELREMFGPNIYRDVKKLRRWGFISIQSRDGKKKVVLRPEAEAYIIRRRGRS